MPTPPITVRDLVVWSTHDQGHLSPRERVDLPNVLDLGQLDRHDVAAMFRESILLALAGSRSAGAVWRTRGGKRISYP